MKLLLTPSAEEVRQFRARCKWSQEEMAQVFSVSRQAVAAAEKGGKQLSEFRWTLVMLALNEHPGYRLIPRVST